MQSIVNYLDGKKSYGIAFLTLIYGIYQYYAANGHNWHVIVPYLLSAAGISAIRAAIAKT